MTMLNEKLKTHPEVVTTELDDEEAVLLHLGTKKYYTLNETGVRIWQLLCKGFSVNEIIHKIDNEYEISSESSRISVLRLAKELLDEKLLTRV